MSIKSRVAIGRRLLLGGILFGVLATGAIARKSDSKTNSLAGGKPLSMRQLIERVGRLGADKRLNLKADGLLGYSEEHATKKIFYKQKSVDALNQDRIQLVYTSGNNGELVPKDIIVGNIRVDYRKDERVIDAMDFRCDLNGKLLSAMTAKGVVGRVKQEALSIDDPKVQSDFRKQLRYFTHTAAHRAPSKD